MQNTCFFPPSRCWSIVCQCFPGHVVIDDSANGCDPVTATRQACGLDIDNEEFHLLLCTVWQSSAALCPSKYFRMYVCPVRCVLRHCLPQYSWMFFFCIEIDSCVGGLRVEQIEKISSIEHVRHCICDCNSSYDHCQPVGLTCLCFQCGSQCKHLHFASHDPTQWTGLKYSGMESRWIRGQLPSVQVGAELQQNECRFWRHLTPSLHMAPLHAMRRSGCFNMLAMLFWMGDSACKDMWHARMRFS